MVDRSQEPWIDTNVEVVESYLKKEFENFAIAHQTDQSLTHTFTVTDGKKRFKLFIPWPVLAEKSFTQAGRNRLAHANVAGEMRLHGEVGYLWASSHESTAQRGGM